MEIEACQRELERQTRELQQREIQLQAPATPTASATGTTPATAVMLASAGKELDSSSTASPRKSSAVENGGSRDLSGLTQ